MEVDVSGIKNKFLDVAYANQSKAQRLDIYLPEDGKGPYPVLVYIHGGGFMMGDKRDDHVLTYLKGLERGYAVASVEYRLSKEALFPAAVLDCREALRYLKANASMYSLDTERIAVIGGSAGGNLTAMMGMNIPNGQFAGEDPNYEYGELPIVAAAVDQFGPMDFKSMDAQARANGVSNIEHDEPSSPESCYLGIAVPKASDELCAQANPLTYASKRMCPMLVQHGTVDRLVPYEQSVEFVAGLREKLGEKCVEFTPLTGADHDDKMFSSNENMAVVFKFLDEHIH